MTEENDDFNDLPVDDVTERERERLSGEKGVLRGYFCLGDVYRSFSLSIYLQFKRRRVNSRGPISATMWRMRCVRA